MRDMMFWMAMSAWVAGGCSTYGSGEQKCSSLADCNPDKECGEMIRCVDGRCDPDAVLELPCEQACTSDRDCPAGMHCRGALDGQGVCVADGTCMDAAECLGQPRGECLGTFTCREGACVYQCLDVTSCSRDDDCMLADRACCCGSRPEDYVSVSREDLSTWTDRAECGGIFCPEIACNVPEDIRAVCEQGACTVVGGEIEWTVCTEDEQCVKVPARDCCGCAGGGGEQAVNREFEQTYLDDLQEFCATVDPFCPGYDACTDWPAVCHQGHCRVLRDACGCEGPWDPVCGGTGARMMTFGSACEAECVDIPWHYHGRCDCQMLCDCDVCGCAVCAENGVTYPCGGTEVQCNGQSVAYQGECAPGCEQCALIGRPAIPVCDQDFCSRSDLCYVECRGRDWWHQGACQPGEGARCGTIAGIPCESESLYCLPEQNVPDAAGVCIQLGACREAEHCTGQPLAHDGCVGTWTCQDHACVWECT